MGKMNDKSFVQRMVVAGDWAEGQFESYADDKGIKYERYGFDRSNLPSFRYLPTFIKHTPDYIAVESAKVSYAVECKGCGRGGYINLKPRDIDAYRDWDRFCPLRLFIYDSDKEKIAIVPFAKFIEAWDEHELEEGVWNDGTPYKKVPKNWFTWETAYERKQ